MTPLAEQQIAQITEDQEREAIRMVRENYKGMWSINKVAGLYRVSPLYLEQLIQKEKYKEDVMPKKDAPKKEAPKADAKKDAPKEPKVKRLSYQDKIRAAMAEFKGVATQEELMKATGADSKNLAVAVSILKSAKRQKDPMNVAYDRKTKVYYNMDSANSAKAYNDLLIGRADAEAADKAAAKAEKAAKKAQDKENAKKLAEAKAAKK